MNRTFRILVLVIAMSASALSVWGQRPSPDITVLRPSARVRALCRVGDSLWVGTAAGLFIYDLARDRYVDTVVVGPRLPDNSVRAIRAVGDSVLVATDRGLAVFDADGVELLTRSHTMGVDSIPYERFRSIDIGIDGMMFLGTYGLGVGVIQGDRSWTVTRDDSLLDNKVYATVQEDSFTIYFATSMGLCAWRDSAWVGFQAGAGIPRGEVRSILPASSGDYYLLVSGHGIFRFDGESARRASPTGLFPEDDISAMTVDASGRLWAAGRYGGVAVFSNGHWAPAGEKEPSIWLRPWTCAHADREGGVFFGSDDGVVLAIAEGRMRRIRVPAGLDSGAIGSIATDASGTTFALIASRVLRFDRSAAAPRVEVLPGPAADMALSPSGGLWAAGRFGVFRYDADGFNEFPSDISERDAALDALCFDPRGDLWVAARGGRVYRYDGEIWMRVAEQGELGGSINRLIADADGDVWAIRFGPVDAPVARYFGGIWTLYSGDTFGGESVVAAGVAPDGTVVVATSRRLWGTLGSQPGWRVIVAPKAEEGGAETPIEVTPPRGERFSCFAFDADGVLYVGAGDWVARVETGGGRWISTVDTFAARDVRVLYVFDEWLWAGFRRDGVARAPVKRLW